MPYLQSLSPNDQQMNDTSSIIIPDASAIQVDTSCIDVSEVENQEDKDFLLEKGENILRIVARAALEMGEQLLLIQNRFLQEDGRGAGLKKYYQSLGITSNQVNRWVGSYKTITGYNIKAGEEIGWADSNIMKLSETAQEKINQLPEDVKETVFNEIQEGEEFSADDLRAMLSDPDVKMSKAREMVIKTKLRAAEAREAQEQARIDHGSESAEYEKARNTKKSSEASHEYWEQQIADLEAAIEAEKLKTAEQAEQAAQAEAEKASIEKELQKLKFDDAKVRAERVKKLSTTLTVSLPQALADVSKFFAEIDQYPEEVRDHIYNSAKVLANEIADKL